jgi:transcriptional regulator
MYQPAHFVETDRNVLHALIRAHPLGLLISATAEGPVADPVPFLLDADVGPNGRLRAHVARANPQRKIISDNPEVPVLIVFQGADSYITPSWYETKRETGKVVPTWNYAIVQVRGRARAVEDTAWLAGQIRELTTMHEASRSEPWHVEDAPERFIEAQLRGIVGIEIDIAEMHGKWKVSQNRPEADRVGVAEGLAGVDGAAGMTELVRRYGKLD